MTLLELYLSMGIPQEVTDVLVGTVLGDARMNFANIFDTASFYFEQGLIHKSYVFYLFGLLSAYAVNTAPTLRNYVDSRTGRKGSSYFFSLKTIPAFAYLAQMFYVTNISNYIKVIPWDCIYVLLTPRALAFWIMDDGQYVKRGGLTLCTDNYSFADVFLLMMVLEMKFGLVCTIHTKDYANRSKIYYRIHIRKGSLPLLRSLVSEHMHPDFMYKLDD